MAGSDSQIDKPHYGRPKRAEPPDVNINTGAQSINTERASLIKLYFTSDKLSILKGGGNWETSVNRIWYVAPFSITSTRTKRQQPFRLLLVQGIQYCMNHELLKIKSL